MAWAGYEGKDGKGDWNDCNQIATKLQRVLLNWLKSFRPPSFSFTIFFHFSSCSTLTRATVLSLQCFPHKKRKCCHPKQKRTALNKHIAWFRTLVLIAVEFWTLWPWPKSVRVVDESIFSSPAGQFWDIASACQCASGFRFESIEFWTFDIVHLKGLECDGCYRLRYSRSGNTCLGFHMRSCRLYVHILQLLGISMDINGYHVSRCVKMCQDVSRCVKMCQDASRCVKMRQDASRCVKMCQDVSRCVKMCQDVSRCVKMCQDVSRCVKVCQGVSRCVKMCQDVSRCVKCCGKVWYELSKLESSI